jgi:hypothetical protein
LAFSYWFDKPWFLTEGKLAVVLIIPSSWGSQLGGHLHQHRTTIKLFSGAVIWEERRFLQGEFRTHILYFVLVLLYFIFACIVLSKIQKKISFLLVVIFTCLLLALLE